MIRAKQFDEATAELSAAVTNDFGKSEAGFVMGMILIHQDRFEGAGRLYAEIQTSDPDFPQLHTRLSLIYFQAGDLENALREAKAAIAEIPINAAAHLNAGLALANMRKFDAAKSELLASIRSKPDYARAYVAQAYFDAERKYSNAQQRFQQHLADLRSTGKSAEADDLEAALRSKDSTAGLDGKYHDAMQSGKQAMMEKRWSDAETSAKQAIEIAEKIQPQDARLPDAFGLLGGAYAWRMDFKDAEAAYKRQLALSEKLYGPKSPLITIALESLGMLAAQQKDCAEAESFFSRGVDLNASAFGDDSTAVADILRGLASVYLKEENFAKSESTMLRVVRVYESTYGDEDPHMSIALGSLCYIYDQWDKPDKSAPCHARIVAMAEKQFGPDSPFLVRDLTAEAKSLRQLGRNEEAAKLEQRTQALQSAQTNPN
jgi:tetratricopeptide (TPR) repeat protein